MCASTSILISVYNDQILLSLLRFKQYLTGLFIYGLYYKHIFIDLSQFMLVKVGKVLFVIFDCQNWLTLLQLFFKLRKCLKGHAAVV